MEVLNNIIDDRLDRKIRLKRIRGTIIGIVEYPEQTEVFNFYTGETEIRRIDKTKCGRVRVSVDGKELSLLNKSHEVLSIGDEVWIHYWTNISSGYVALKIGKSNYNYNIDKEPYPLIMPFSIKRCYGIKKKITTNNKTYSYMVDRESMDLSVALPKVGEITAVETKDAGINHIRTYYVSSLAMDNDTTVIIDFNPSTNYHNDFTVKNYKKQYELYEMTSNGAKVSTHAIEIGTATYQGEEIRVVEYVTYVDEVRSTNKILSWDADDYDRWFLYLQAGNGEYNTSIDRFIFLCDVVPCHYSGEDESSGVYRTIGDESGSRFARIIVKTKDVTASGTRYIVKQTIT